MLVGTAESLVVSGGADAVSNLQSRVENGTLVLQQRKRGLWMLQGRDSVKLRVTLPVLKSMVINGASRATLTWAQRRRGQPPRKRRRPASKPTAASSA